jgi:DNA-directed RNA polymerase subunit alpha
MEIWTKGTIGSDEALVEAAKILRKHLNPFVQYSEMGEEIVTEQVEEFVTAPAPVDSELQKKLAVTIAELELSVRASNCLEAAKIVTVAQLAQKTESDLLNLRSFGKTSLREVKRKLADMGLSLGMAVGSAGQGDAAGGNAGGEATSAESPASVG